MLVLLPSLTSSSLSSSTQLHSTAPCFLFLCLVISSNNISQISGSGSQVKKIFILCEHGTKANIGSAKMANNRHAVNRNFLQNYWTSDGLSLYSSQPAFEKTHQTNTVKELPRSGRPRVTSQREDGALHRLVRRMPFATSPVLKRQWLPNSGLSARTVRNRLKSAGLKSRRVSKRPILSNRHQ